MERPIFDSRSPLYKTPFGAVPCGRHITLTLYPPVEENFTGGALILNLEFAGEIREIPLVPAPDPSASPEAPVSETAAADCTGSDSDTVGGQGGAAAPEGEGTVPAEESSAASVPAVFTVAYTAPAEPELIWYCFRFTRRDGSAAFLGKNGCAARARPPAGSRQSMTTSSPPRSGLAGASPIRSSPTASTAPSFPIPPGCWGTGSSTRTGRS